MKNTRIQRTAAVLLLISILALTGTGQTFAAEDQFALNASGLFPEKLETQEEHLFVRGIPDLPGYRFVRMRVFDEGGQAVLDIIQPRSSTGDAAFDLSSLDAGEYFLSLSHSSWKDTSFTADFSQAVRLSRDAENTRFLRSPAWVYNESASETASPQQEALDFYLRPSAGIQSDDPRIKARAASLSDGLSGEGEKAKAIHDWVCCSICYDYDAYYGRVPHGDCSAAEVFQSRRSVCAGYANLTTALLRAAGIPARKISGFTTGTSSPDWPRETYDGTLREVNHAWCEAYYGGHWAVLDTTWDSCNRYEFGEVTCSDGIDDYRYFDISRDLLSADHAAVSGFTYGSLYLYIGYPKFWNNQTREWRDIDAWGSAPVLKNGRTLVPLAPVMEAMGGTVEWVNGTQTSYPKITCRFNGMVATMWVGYPRFYVDGLEYTFDVVPQIINGRTMVPFSVLLEAMGCSATWDGFADNWNGRVTVRYSR